MIASNIKTFWKNASKEAKHQADQLEATVVNLRFEGKVHFGKNIKSVMSSVKSLEHWIKLFFDVQDRIVFRFLKSHIPKTESMLSFFQSEHNQLKQGLVNIDEAVELVAKTKSPVNRTRIIAELKDRGVYLSCLLRKEIEVECESIHRMISQELKPDERGDLYVLMSKFIGRNG